MVSSTFHLNMDSTDIHQYPDRTKGLYNQRDTDIAINLVPTARKRHSYTDLTDIHRSDTHIFDPCVLEDTYMCNSTYLYYPNFHYKSLLYTG